MQKNKQAHRLYCGVLITFKLKGILEYFMPSHVRCDVQRMQMTILFFEVFMCSYTVYIYVDLVKHGVLIFVDEVLHYRNDR